MAGSGPAITVTTSSAMVVTANAAMTVTANPAATAWRDEDVEAADPRPFRAARPDHRHTPDTGCGVRKAARHIPAGRGQLRSAAPAPAARQHLLARHRPYGRRYLQPPSVRYAHHHSDRRG